MKRKFLRNYTLTDQKDLIRALHSEQTIVCWTTNYFLSKVKELRRVVDENLRTNAFASIYFILSRTGIEIDIIPPHKNCSFLVRHGSF
jgi:hypothetical protein